MGVISLEKMDNIYWLGRYTERTYTTIKEFFDGFDVMIENPDYYKEYCTNLDIPNVYESAEDFTEKYLFDDTNVNSVISTMNGIYNNAVVLRDVLGTESISYVELALTEIETAKSKTSVLMNLQRIIDYLLAFIACIDENVDGQVIRGIFKTARRQERMDLVLRLRKDEETIQKAFHMLTARVLRKTLPVNREAYNELAMLANESKLCYAEMIQLVEQLFEV